MKTRNKWFQAVSLVVCNSKCNLLIIWTWKYFSSYFLLFELTQNYAAIELKCSRDCWSQRKPLRWTKFYPLLQWTVSMKWNTVVGHTRMSTAFSDILKCSSIVHRHENKKLELNLQRFDFRTNELIIIITLIGLNCKLNSLKKTNERANSYWAVHLPFHCIASNADLIDGVVSISKLWLQLGKYPWKPIAIYSSSSEVHRKSHARHHHTW